MVGAGTGFFVEELPLLFTVAVELLLLLCWLINDCASSLAIQPQQARVSFFIPLGIFLLTVTVNLYLLMNCWCVIRIGYPALRMRIASNSPEYFSWFKTRCASNALGAWSLFGLIMRRGESQSRHERVQIVLELRCECQSVVRLFRPDRRLFGGNQQMHCRRSQQIQQRVCQGVLVLLHEVRGIVDDISCEVLHREIQRRPTIPPEIRRLCRCTFFEHVVQLRYELLVAALGNFDLSI